jgi:hypothetical protein
VIVTIDYLSRSAQLLSAPSQGASDLLQTYSNYVLAGMNPQQFDIISNYLSFKTLSSYKSVVSSAVALSTPLSDTELLGGIQSDSFSLAVKSGVGAVRVGLVLTSLSSLPAQLSSYVHSNPVMLSIQDLTVCASSRCGLTVVLQTVDNAVFFNGSASAGGFSTVCRVGDNSTHINQCANGMTTSAQCDGKSLHSVQTRCPYIVTQPACARLSASSSSATNDVCTVSSYSSTSTTCVCSIPSSSFTSSRRLLKSWRALTATTGALQLGTTTVTSTVSPIVPTLPSYFPTAAPSQKVIHTILNPEFSVAEKITVSVVTSVVGCCLFLLGLLLFARSRRLKSKSVFAIRRLSSDPNRSVQDDDHTLRQTMALDGTFNQRDDDDDRFVPFTENILPAAITSHARRASKLAQMPGSPAPPIQVEDIDMEIWSQMDSDCRDIIPPQESWDAKSMENGDPFGVSSRVHHTVQVCSSSAN